MREEVTSYHYKQTVVPAKNFVPYTYKEIREIYRGFAGDPNELRMLMDFTALRKADAKFLLDNLKNDIGRKAS